VTRTYSTRHGAGPFVADDAEWAERFPDPTNVLGEWQGNFRVGPLDRVMLRYATEAVGGVDQVALTYMDRAPEVPFIVTGYSRPESRLDRSLVTSLTPPQIEGECGYQQRLGELLAGCSPIVSPMTDPVAEVEQAVNAPVTILGYGPKAEDKQQRAGEVHGEAARSEREASQLVSV
jgi:adenylosuccinate synthase